MSELSVAAAAAELRVTGRQVTRLAKNGELTVAREVGGILLLDANSVHRLAHLSRHRGRPWGQDVAWAALSLLSGDSQDWIAGSQKTRLKHRLRRSTAEEVAFLARRRAIVHRMRGWDAELASISEVLSATGSHAVDERTPGTDRFGLTPATESVTIDGYLPSDKFTEVVNHFGLVKDPEVNVTIRLVTVSNALQAGSAPLAAVAVDLMESLNTRERSAGLRILQELLLDFT